MKGVMLEVPEHVLAERRRTGVDRFDEMWEGVLHMAPAPAYEHQRIVTALVRFLAERCEHHRRGTVTVQINVFNEASAETDYRIPDLTFVAAGREHLLAEDGVRGGGPDAVIEVRSPRDESYDKLPFFARLGVREVIVIDRDTKRPQIFRLAGTQYVEAGADGDQTLTSEVLRVRLVHDQAASRLVIEDVDDATARTEI